eukprot:351665-Chlamydomonas_euryale.AAC.3
MHGTPAGTSGARDAHVNVMRLQPDLHACVRVCYICQVAPFHGQVLLCMSKTRCRHHTCIGARCDMHSPASPTIMPQQECSFQRMPKPSYAAADHELSSSCTNDGAFTALGMQPTPMLSDMGDDDIFSRASVCKIAGADGCEGLDEDSGSLNEFLLPAPRNQRVQTLYAEAFGDVDGASADSRSVNDTGEGMTRSNSLPMFHQWQGPHAEAAGSTQSKHPTGRLTPAGTETGSPRPHRSSLAAAGLRLKKLVLLRSSLAALKLKLPISLVRILLHGWLHTSDLHMMASPHQILLLIMLFVRDIQQPPTQELFRNPRPILDH